MEEQLLFMTDQHIPYINERMERITLNYCKDNKNKIKYLVFGGDSVDNPAMSVFPERPDSKSLLQEELDLFIEHVNRYHLIVPKAKIIILTGNHDSQRLERVVGDNKSLASLRSVQYKNLLKESINAHGYNFKIKVTNKFLLKSYNTYFTHGDPRIDPYLKGGVTGVRRSAEMHPIQGNIVTGHKHQVISYPRTLGDCSFYSVGMMADTNSTGMNYLHYHGYQQGFLVIRRLSKRVQVDNVQVTNEGLYYNGKVYD